MSRIVLDQINKTNEINGINQINEINEIDEIKRIVNFQGLTPNSILGNKKILTKHRIYSKNDNGEWKENCFNMFTPGAISSNI